MVIPPNPNARDFNDAPPQDGAGTGTEALEQAALDVLRAEGFLVDVLQADGRKHYCCTEEKRRGNHAAYMVFLDEKPLVWMRKYYLPEDRDNPKTVKLGQWRRLTPEEHRKWDERAARRREEDRRIRDAAAAKARARLEKLRPAEDGNAYLKAKGVPAVPGLFAQGKALVVPMRSAMGEVRSLQSVFFDVEEGRFAKLFTADSDTLGMTFEIPASGDGGDEWTLFCEGVATGVDVWRATGGGRTFVCFSCGGLRPAAEALIAAGKCSGDKCIFVADNDWKKASEGKGNSGVQCAIDAARAVGGVFCVPVENGETFADGRDMTDANDVAQAYGLDVLGQRLSRVEMPPAPGPGEASLPAGPGAEQDDDPMPLRRESGRQAPYPVEAFGPLSGAVDALARHCYVHSSVAGLVVLSCLSLFAQRLFNVKSRLYTTPLSLFGLSVMESGGGKDMVEDLALLPMERWEREQEPEYERRMQAYKVADAVYRKSLSALEKRFSKMDGDAEREQYRAELEALEKAKPAEPSQPILTGGDLNVEGLFRILKERSPSYAVFGSEGGILFGGMAFQKENKMRTQGVFCGAWSKGEFDKLRMGEGASKLRDRRVCMHLMVQPCIASKLFSDADMERQGFLPRSLITWPATMSRDVEDVDIAGLPEMQSYYEACRALLELKPPQDDVAGKGLSLGELRLDGAEFRRYQGFYREMEAQILPGGKYAPVRGYARRAAEQAIRIAGVLSAAWAPHSGDVSAEAMEAGIALARWHLDEVLRIVSGEADDPDLSRAEELMQWLSAKGIERTSARQVQTHCRRAGLGTKKRIEEAFAVLVDHGWLSPVGRADVWDGDGRPPRTARKAYAVRPGYGT